MLAGLRQRLSTQWAFYLTVLFLFSAALFRTLVIYWLRPELLQALLLLSAWMVVFLTQPSISHLWKSYFPIYLVIQTGLTILLYRLPVYPDYFAVLLAVLTMQIIQQYSAKTAIFLIAVFTPIMVIMIIPSLGTGQAIALGVLYTGTNVLMASFASTVQRAQMARQNTQKLMQSLSESNRQLQDYAFQLEGLAVARERNNLARELHDSVTQTVFSMTLATKSALVLVDRDPSRVGEQMERLNTLAQSALSELRVLISELGPNKDESQDLLTRLKQYSASKNIPDNLVVDVEVVGQGSISKREVKAIYRIVQEALNNTAKHARANHACVRLHLEEPYWVEVEDNGQGFDPQQVFDSSHIGLRSMRERAMEVGWEMNIFSSPSASTRIRVERVVSRKAGSYGS